MSSSSALPETHCWLTIKHHIRSQTMEEEEEEGARR